MTILQGEQLTLSQDTAYDSLEIAGTLIINGSVKIKVENDMRLLATGVIDGTGRSSYGPGARGVGTNVGPGAPDNCGYSRGGGSHGGRGGGYHSNDCTSDEYVYGDLFAPVTMGSGGEAECANCARGGAALHLQVSGELLLNGTIKVDGDYGANPESNDGAYVGQYSGGSGGSAWIEAGVLSGGGGVVSVVGGKGYQSYGGGGGGGGRIALYCGLSTYAMGGAPTLSASGGMGYYYQSNWADGGPGTVYVDCGGMRRTLLVDSEGKASGYDASGDPFTMYLSATSSNYSFGSVRLRGARLALNVSALSPSLAIGQVSLESSSALTLWSGSLSSAEVVVDEVLGDGSGSLTVESGVVLEVEQMQVAPLDSMTIRAGSEVLSGATLGVQSGSLDLDGALRGARTLWVGGGGALELTPNATHNLTLLQLNATDARVTLPWDDTFELETIAVDAGTLRVRGEVVVRATTLTVGADGVI
ncbi:MAG: hypothetical protein VYD05_07170, partial [Planctomycetota bacterium]|nr:hypothetical protein [Planctomycetota bacterium]